MPEYILISIPALGGLNAEVRVVFPEMPGRMECLDRFRDAVKECVQMAIEGNNLDNLDTDDLCERLTKMGWIVERVHSKVALDIDLEVSRAEYMDEEDKHF
jgi:hypothetical protein